MCSGGFFAAMAHVLSFPEMVASTEKYYQVRNKTFDREDMDAFNSGLYCLIQNLA